MGAGRRRGAGLVKWLPFEGRYASGQTVNKTGSASTDWQVAPAIEYNWNARWGVIAGSSVYYAGHNTGIKVSPQFAINTVF